MKIVIDIPEENYKNILNGFGLRSRVFDAIRNGKPLPKGHGRLIDANALGQELHRYNTAPYQYALKVFEEATTIIEAARRVIK